MNLEDLVVYNQTRKKHYSSDQIMDVLDGGTGGNRAAARTTMTAAYTTPTTSPTVYYTALKPDGTTLTARTTSGVTHSACGDYIYTQNIVGIDQFVAVWDEGDVNNYTSERIMVDT